MKFLVELLIVMLFLATFILELVLCDKKAKKLHEVYNTHRSNDSVSNAYTRIIGGKGATMGVWPWQAVLVENNPGRSIFCGGSLIARNWVLTAAHCVTDDQGNVLPRNNFLVRLGSYKSFDTPEKFARYGQEFVVAQVIVYGGQFDRQTATHDAALLRLNNAAAETEYVKIVRLPQAADAKYLVTGKVCVATGFGDVDEQGTLPARMQEVRVNIADHAKCVDLYRPHNDVPDVDDSMICAGRLKGKYSTCTGDSGGPLVCKHEDPRTYYLHGITSWELGCAQPHQYGVYASVINLLDWINQNAV